MHTLIRAAAAALLAAVGPATWAAGPPPSISITGVVLETLNVDSYTYARLKTSEGEIWAAVPKAALKNGSRITIGSAMTAENFESKALKRKFDRLVFGEIVEPGATAVTAAAPHAAAPSAMATATAPSPVARVPKATGPMARTVAEVVSGKAALKDRPVLVRAQVVKVSAGILGKNWLHLQDGSGSAADGSHDILVTTRDEAAEGDIVTAQGTVRTQVDLGAGYRYPVLIEDAAVRK